ncbi:MAG: MoaD/ThiS family protein [Candidatus Binatia bacterium]
MTAPLQRPTGADPPDGRRAQPVNVKLSGRWGLPDIERELARGPIDLDLPADVTGQGLLQCLADRYGSSFQRKALKLTGELRAEVRLFVDDDPVEDLAVRIGDKLSRGAEVSIVLLAPLIGG